MNSDNYLAAAEHEVPVTESDGFGTEALSAMGAPIEYEGAGFAHAYLPPYDEVAVCGAPLGAMHRTGQRFLAGRLDHCPECLAIVQGVG
jgi:hypothetical protein